MEDLSRQSLLRALAYDSAVVKSKFRSAFAVSAEEADGIFTETVKWLWLCHQWKTERASGTCMMRRPPMIHVTMVVIDEMWHTFILHTKEYGEFCESQFGNFVHHSPARPDFEPLTEDETREQLGYICSKLGPETVIKWYEDYAERYSPERLTEIARPHMFGRPCEVSS